MAGTVAWKYSIGARPSDWSNDVPGVVTPIAYNRDVTDGSGLLDSTSIALLSAAMRNDSFSGSNGAALDSTNWSVNTTTGSSVSILNNQARFITGVQGGYADGARATFNAATVADARITGTFTPQTSAENYFAIALRSSGVDANLMANTYKVEFANWGGVSVGKNINFATTTPTGGAGVAIPGYAVGTPINVDITIAGSTVTVYAWTGATKPTTPLITATDTTFTAAGRFGLSLNGGNTATATTWDADDFSYTPASAAGASYAQTSTDLTGLTDTTAPVLTAGAQTLTSSATDRTGLTDATTPTLTAGGSALTSSATDTTGLTDATLRALAAALGLTDLAGLTDATTRTLTSGGATQVTRADAFTGSNGAALSTTNWSVTTTTGSSATILNNAARFSAGGLGSYNDIVRATVNAEAASDARITGTFTPRTTAEQYMGIFLRSGGADAALAANAYKVEFANWGGVSVGENANYQTSVPTGGAGVAIPGYAVDVPINVDITISGSTTTVYAWTGSTKPSSPLITVTDTTYAGPGRFGLILNGGPSTAAAGWDVDDWSYVATAVGSGGTTPGNALTGSSTDRAGLTDTSAGTLVSPPPTGSAMPRLLVSSGGIIRKGSTTGPAFRTGGMNIFQIVNNDYPNSTTGRLMSHSEIDSLLGKLAGLKVGIIRAHTLGVNIGSQSSHLVAGVSGTTSPVISYRAAVWEVMDYAISVAASLGIYLMIPLTDELGYYHGGKRQWVNYRRPGTCSTDGNVKSANSSAERAAENYFYSDPQIKLDYKTYISDWLNHVNQYTGNAYKNEPCIAFIETGNELWTADDYRTWTPEIATYIKSIAPNVLVADGMAADGSGYWAGLTPAQDPIDHIITAEALACKDIALHGIHPYSVFTAADVASAAAKCAAANKAFGGGEYGWSKPTAQGIRDAVKNAPNGAFSAPWSLQNDADAHNGGSGAGYGGDDASLYYPSKDATQQAAITAMQAHSQALQDMALSQ